MESRFKSPMTTWFSMLCERHTALKLVATKKWIRLPFGCNLQPHAIEEQDETTLVCKP